MKLQITVCEAINKSRLIKFKYKNEVRIVEPYVYGLSTANKYVFRAFQVENESKPLETGWRLFDENLVQDLVILEESFRPRVDYNKFDSAFKNILCNVK